MSRHRDLATAIQQILDFSGPDLRTRIKELESLSRSNDRPRCERLLIESGASGELLARACSIKQAVGQINVIIHVLGILLLVSKVLEPGETIQYVSLGAGNTGRPFDLETDRRVAEFKFINWRGRDSVRQDSLFKDFYLLAEHPTTKRKELYVVDLSLPMKFLRGRRKVSSVLARHENAKKEFNGRYGDRFVLVHEYFEFRKNDIHLIDATTLIPELALVIANPSDSPHDDSY